MTSFQSKPSTNTGLVATTKNLFWTVYYFFYFLLTGQPEWKCESHRPEPLIACCSKEEEEEAEKERHETASAANFKWSAEPTFRSNGHASLHHQKQGFFARVWQNVKWAAGTAWDFTKRAGRWVWSGSVTVLKAVGRFLAWIWSWITRGWAWLRSLGASRQAKSLPAPTTSTPKPFSPDSPSFNKVEFHPEEKFLSFKENLEATINSQLGGGENEEYVAENNQTSTDRQHHYEQREMEQEEAPEPTRQFREVSAPPPPPPPPPQKPIRIERSAEPEEREERRPIREHKEVKEGIPHLSKEVLAELTGKFLCSFLLRNTNGTGALRNNERGPSVQRELTQSCHPDMDEWKHDRFDRSGTATRASSVGPTMRKLEHFVSRLEDSSDNEAQFVFRPPAREASSYKMGPSVFSPVDEAEKMRENINRSYYEPRPITPASFYTDRRYGTGESELRQRAKTVDPPARAFTPSFAYSNAPFTSHTARRSKTPVAFDRSGNFAYDRDDVTNGVVTNTARRWPPVSNATGAAVEKDNWLNDVLGTSDDGLITTMCRRVVEKKTEDNWKWKDDAGKLVDEKNQRSWKGELDTVVRDGPQQGRQWSRTVELKPNGTTLFQDVSRQYDRNYVVESVIRNY